MGSKKEVLLRRANTKKEYSNGKSELGCRMFFLTHVSDFISHLLVQWKMDYFKGDSNNLLLKNFCDVGSFKSLQNKKPKKPTRKLLETGSV